MCNAARIGSLVVVLLFLNDGVSAGQAISNYGCRQNVMDNFESLNESADAGRALGRARARIIGVSCVSDSVWKVHILADDWRQMVWRPSDGRNG